MCVCARACVLALVRMHMCLQARCWYRYFICHFTSAVIHGLSLNLEHTNWARLVGQQSLEPVCICFMSAGITSMNHLACFLSGFQSLPESESVKVKPSAALVPASLRATALRSPRGRLSPHSQSCFSVQEQHSQDGSLAVWCGPLLYFCFSWSVLTLHCDI